MSLPTDFLATDFFLLYSLMFSLSLNVHTALVDSITSLCAELFAHSMKRTRG